MANFIKTVGNFHRNALKQVRNNIVSLGSKNHRIARSRHDVLHNKLEKADGMTQQFLQRVDRYNTKYEQFRDECGYFHDYEKDVLKYYSVSHNN